MRRKLDQELHANGMASASAEANDADADIDTNGMQWEPADTVPARPSTPVHTGPPSSKAGSVGSMDVQAGGQASDDDFDPTAMSNPVAPMSRAGSSRRLASRSTIASADAVFHAKPPSAAESSGVPDWLDEDESQEAGRRSPAAAPAAAAQQHVNAQQTTGERLKHELASRHAGPFSGGFIREEQGGGGDDASMKVRAPQGAANVLLKESGACNQMGAF